MKNNDNTWMIHLAMLSDWTQKESLWRRSVSAVLELLKSGKPTEGTGKSIVPPVHFQKSLFLCNLGR